MVYGFHAKEVEGGGAAANFDHARVENVPRIAATLASLLLIVSSIGVNIARYPIVSQMVGGLDHPSSPVAKADSPGEVAPAPQQPAKKAITAAKPAVPAEHRRSKKMPQASVSPTAKAPIAAATVVDVSPAAAATPAPMGRILDVGPLVPVVQAGQPAEPARIAQVDDEVRRLPAVDPVVPATQPMAGEGPRQSYLMTATP